MKRPSTRRPLPALPPAPGTPAHPPSMPASPTPRPTVLGLAVILALLPSACFNPMIMLETDDATSDASSTGSDADPSEGTASEPDGGSGDPLPVCGDGVVEGDEVCDDGTNDGSYGGCAPGCTALGPSCGDGLVNGDEPCDDGDALDGNGCNTNCLVSGSVLWTVTYDGEAHGIDIASSVAVDSQDDIVVAGRSTVGDASWAWVAKYSPDGQLQWSQVDVGLAGESAVYDLAVLPDDDIVAVGSVDDGFGSTDAWVRRYSASGDTVWTRIHGGVTDEVDVANAVMADDSGNVYVAIDEGQIAIGNDTISMLRKYTSDGQELWTIYEPAGTRINDITRLLPATLLIAGRTGDNSFWTPVLQGRNSDGGLEWEEIRGDQAPGWYSAIDANAAGDIALVLALQGENDARVIHLDAARQEVWSELPWGFASITRDVTIDGLGWLSCTGGGGVDSTLWTRKYLPDGLTAWTDTYNGPEALLGIDQGEGIARDSLGHIISVGYVMDDENAEIDAWIRKLAP